MYKPPIAPIPTAPATSVAPRRQIFVPDRSFHMEALHVLQTLRIKSALVTDTWYESYEYSWFSLDRAPIWRPKRLAVPMKREASHSWLRRPKRLKGWNHLKPLRKGQERPGRPGKEHQEKLGELHKLSQSFRVWAKAASAHSCGTPGQPHVQQPRTAAMLRQEMEPRPLPQWNTSCSWHGWHVAMTLCGNLLLNYSKFPVSPRRLSERA